MSLKKSLLIIIFSLINFYSFSQFELPETVTIKREYTQDSTILLIVNERKYKDQEWQTYFEVAYFKKNKTLINGGLIFGATAKGLNFKFSWTDSNKIKVTIPKGVKFFKKNSVVELGKNRNGVTPITIYITYEEK